MTLLNKVTTNTIHFSVHTVSTQSRPSGTEMLILLLYLAVQLDLCTFADKLFAMFTVQLQAVADTWIPKENHPTQPSSQREISCFSLDH